MNPHNSWLERTRELSPEQMRVLAGTMSHHINGLHLHVPDLLLLQHHYYRAALMYTVTHNDLVQDTFLQARRSFLFSDRGRGLNPGVALPAQTLARYAALRAHATQLGEAIDPDALQDAGLTPGHFSRLLALHGEQSDWTDLLDVQLRHFDPKGMWHVIVTFPNPRGEPLQLHLRYRDAEAYGFGLGLEPDPEWMMAGTPTIQATVNELTALTGLAPHTFPACLTPLL